MRCYRTAREPQTAKTRIISNTVTVKCCQKTTRRLDHSRPTASAPTRMPTLTLDLQRLRPRACPRSLPARSVCAHAHAHAHSRPAASAPTRMPMLTLDLQRLRPRACPRSLPARSVCAHAHAHANSRPAASAPKRMPTLTPGPQRLRPRACPRSLPACNAHTHSQAQPAANYRHHIHAL
jgi:hypothetical protein